MFHTFAPAVDGAAAETGFNAFGTGFDFASQFGYGKNPVMASPNTDSLEGDLSTSSGGVLRESVPQSYLSPSSAHMSSGAPTGCTGNTIARHPSVDVRSLGPMSSTLNQNAHGHATSNNNNSNGNSNANKTFGAGSPLFHFSTGSHPTATTHATHNAAAAAEEAEQDSGLLDYAGLESLLMAAVGDGSNTPTPTHHAQGSAAAPLSSPQVSPFGTQATLGASGVKQSRAEPSGRSPDSVSPVPSRGSNSAPLAGGGSPNVYSGEGAFLYSNFGPEFIGSLPTPQILQTHVVDATAPLVVAPSPANGALPHVASNAPGELSTHTSSVMLNSSCNVSHSATSTGGNVSVSSQPNDAEVRSNLFICGLPITITDSDLAEIFGKYGPIESAKVMLDIHTGRSRGIAFVKFREVEHAENAVDTLNGTTMNGHPITVRVANSRAAYLPGNPTNKTFVRNVPLAVSRSTLMEYFAQFGEVTDLSIKSDTAQGRHHGGRSLNAVLLDESSEDKLNIVFITYATKEAAARAAEATHTKAPFKECNGVPLLAKVAEDTTRRMERLSRRVRSGPGAESSKDMSTSTTTATTPLTYAVQPGMLTPAMLSMTAAGNSSVTTASGSYPAATYVTVPGLSAADLNGLAMMQAAGNAVSPQMQQQQQQQQQQMSVFRDANGNLIYAAAPPSHAGLTYTVQSHPQQQQQQQQQQNVYFAPQTPPQPQLQQQTVYIQTPNGLMASQAPQFQIFQQQQQQQQLHLQNAQGQIMYVQTANGSVVPVMYGGAASNNTAQPQGMNSYYMMMNN